MNLHAPVFWALCGLFAITGVAHADTKADTVLAQARQASGGSAWDTLHSLEMEAEANSSFMGAFAYRTTVSLSAAPRERARIEVGKKHMVWAWDGQKGWNRGPNGTVQRLEQPAEIAERRTVVFGDAYGYFFPERVKAERHYVGQRKHQGTEYDVVRVTPEGGATVELWVNLRTQRVEGQVGTVGDPVQRQQFSDFRTVNGLALPFVIESFDAASGKQLDRTTVKGYRANVDISDADFAAPNQTPNADN